MLVEAAVAIGSGIAARSIALTSFGADSLIELFSAGVVLRQLVRRANDGHDEPSGRGERQASRLVGWALYAVIAYILISSAVSLVVGDSARALADRHRPHRRRDPGHGKRSGDGACASPIGSTAQPSGEMPRAQRSVCTWLEPRSWGWC